MYDFRFIYFLTLIHSLFTLSGMMAFSAFGLYKRKAVPVMQVGPTLKQRAFDVCGEACVPPAICRFTCLSRLTQGSLDPFRRPHRPRCQLPAARLTSQ